MITVRHEGPWVTHEYWLVQVSAQSGFHDDKLIKKNTHYRRTYTREVHTIEEALADLKLTAFCKMAIVPRVFRFSNGPWHSVSYFTHQKFKQNYKACIFHRDSGFAFTGH